MHTTLNKNLFCFELYIFMLYISHYLILQLTYRYYITLTIFYLCKHVNTADNMTNFGDIPCLELLDKN